VKATGMACSCTVAQKCCVFWKLLSYTTLVPYRIRTAMKMTKELEPRSLHPRIRRCSNWR